MEVEKTHRWCLMCTSYFKLDPAKEHKCYFTNEDLCEYSMCYIDERGTAIYFCSFCNNITKMNQDVKCKAAAYSVITQDQISHPYFCGKLDCPLHLGFQTIFCTHHPDFSNATIIEYGIHEYET